MEDQKWQSLRSQLSTQLTREVAYNSLLMERRNELHERVGRAIEELATSSLDDHFANLAHHYERSDNRIKAIEYLTRAAGQTAQRAAYAEAKQHLMRALDIHQGVPPDRSRDSREMKLQTAIGLVELVTEGEDSGDAGRAFARLLELAVAVDDVPRKLQALNALGYNHLARRELRRASEIAQVLYSLCHARGDPGPQAQADYLIGSIALTAGEFRKAEQHIAAAAAADPARTPIAFRGPASAMRGLVLWHLGFPDKALASVREGLMLGEDEDEPYS